MCKKETYVWVTRDSDGDLRMWDKHNKPFRHETHNYWDDIDCMWIEVNFDLPQVKADDDEPTLIKLSAEIEEERNE